ncbi:methyltransferase regulatory domain-containing protein [Rhodobacteraceae bacterium NNCM2]|nr:methyltransferase regulatory domain-containing protein [Coraliihabitans acroporae]
MTGKLDGYVTELAYPTNFHRELTPAWIAAALRWAGVTPPPERGPIRLLDLGCGDGVALGVIAASYPEGQFTGIDAMSDHIDKGRAFARAHGIGNLDLRCQTFEQALVETHAPYDYITCQGVVAWVSAENRRRVLDFAGRHLVRGGVFHVAYNAMPGWQDRQAMQRMLRLWAEGEAGNATERFQSALAAVTGLSELGAAALPPERLEELHKMGATLPADYFPHEYLNENWRPLWFADMAAEMADRGLDFAGQTLIARAREDFRLKRAQREAISDITHPIRRESAIDLLTNTPFRTDLYVREPTRGDPAELKPQSWLAATTTVEEATFSAATRAGRLRFDNPAARAILKELESRPRQIDDLIGRLEFSAADILNAVDALLVGSHVLPASPPAVVDGAARFNRALGAGNLTGAEHVIFAASGRHGAVTSPRSEMLLASTPPADLLARAKVDPALRELLFDADADLDDPDLPGRVEAAGDRARRWFARQGVAFG